MPCAVDQVDAAEIVDVLTHSLDGAVAEHLQHRLVGTGDEGGGNGDAGSVEFVSLPIDVERPIPVETARESSRREDVYVMLELGLTKPLPRQRRSLGEN